MSDRACPFAFAVTTFSVKDLLLLCCLMIITSPPNLPSTERTMVNVYKILKIFIPCYFMVFVMKGILCLCLSFPCFRDSISKVTTLWKCLTAWISQKQPLDAGSCSMQFLIWGHAETDQQAEFLWAWRLYERCGGCTLLYLTSILNSGKFSIPQLIEQIFYASALYS